MKTNIYQTSKVFADNALDKRPCARLKTLNHTAF